MIVPHSADASLRSSRVRIETVVQVLHLGPLAMLIPVTVMVAYGCGFAIAMLATWGDG